MPVVNSSSRRDDADSVLARAMRSAASRGQVESADLFLALLDTRESKVWDGLVQAGLDATAVRAYLIDELDRIAASEGGVGGTLGMTDTVATAVSQAQARAARHGRAGATAEDLVVGFVESGGGSVGQLFEAFGLPLSHALGVQRRSSPVSEEEDSPFDDSGVLRSSCFEPSAGSALQAAALAAGVLVPGRVNVIPSAMLVVGFAAASSSRLREALHAQGDVGRQAARLLPGEEQADLPLMIVLRREHFTPRTEDVLRRAYRSARQAGSPRADDAAVLRELLRDETSSAATMVDGLGVDLAQMVEWLAASRPRPPDHPPRAPKPDYGSSAEHRAAAQVFISYSMNSDMVALELAANMETEGITVWVARRSLRGGQRFAQEIGKAIGECQVLMLLLTQAAVESDNVKTEVGIAGGAKKGIIPVALEDVELPDELKFWIHGHQRIEAHHRSVSEAMPDIFEALKGCGVVRPS